MCKENASCITINCGCCGNGETGGGGLQGELDLELLFEGEANVVEESYGLLGKIDEYKIVIVECSWGSVENDDILLKYESIINPKTSNIRLQYTCVCGINSYVENNLLGISGISWCFPTTTELKVKSKPLQFNGRDVKITRIYGIK